PLLERRTRRAARAQEQVEDPAGADEAQTGHQQGRKAGERPADREEGGAPDEVQGEHRGDDAAAVRGRGVHPRWVTRSPARRIADLALESTRSAAHLNVFAREKDGAAPSGGRRLFFDRLLRAR